MDFEKLIEGMPLGLIVFEADIPHHIRYGNTEYFHFLEYTEEEYSKLEHHTPWDDIYEFDRGKVKEELKSAFAQRKRYIGKFRVITQRGNIRWTMGNAAEFLNDDGKAYVILTNSDMAERSEEQIKYELKMQEKIRKDSATELYNRKSTEVLVNNYLKMLQKEEHEQGTMMVIDIDNFKTINDTKGHIYGDDVIVSFAKCIREIVKNNALAGRVGGDEFVVFYIKKMERTELEKEVQCILEMFLKKTNLEDDMKKITFSIGIAKAIEHGNDYTELFGNADKALYRAKEKGKNQFVIYGEE